MTVLPRAGRGGGAPVRTVTPARAGTRPPISALGQCWSMSSGGWSGSSAGSTVTISWKNGWKVSSVRVVAPIAAVKVVHAVVAGIGHGGAAAGQVRVADHVLLAATKVGGSADLVLLGVRVGQDCC